MDEIDELTPKFQKIFPDKEVATPTTQKSTLPYYAKPTSKEQRKANTEFFKDARLKKYGPGMMSPRENGRATKILMDRQRG